MKKISLTQGKFAIIDDEDYNELNQYRWSLGRDEARRSFRVVPREQKSISMQEQIMRPKAGQIVLHKNGDRLDNRRENLILGTKGMVNLTRGLQSNNNTGYRGVYRYRNGRFGAKIRVNGQASFLGYYDSAEQAAQVYNQAAYEAWGNLAPLNNFNDLKKPKDDPEGRNRAYIAKVRLNARSRIQLGMYRKILKKADARLLEEDTQPKDIQD